MLTRIISGAVGVVILAAVLFFHNTIVLPIAVAVMIAIMLFELLRAVKLEKCLPILIAAELCGIAMPFIYSGFHYLPDGIIGGADYSMIDGRVTFYAFICVLAAAFVIFVTWLAKH